MLDHPSGNVGDLRFVPLATPAEKQIILIWFWRGGFWAGRSAPFSCGQLAGRAANAGGGSSLAGAARRRALSETFTVDWLYEAISKRSAPIKPVLMDSHLVVGIGNIYAAESLFRAGISPCAPLIHRP